jgi:hypothetical protein
VSGGFEVDVAKNAKTFAEIEQWYDELETREDAKNIKWIPLDLHKKAIELLFALLPISYNKSADGKIEVYDLGKRKDWIKFLEKIEELVGE